MKLWIANFQTGVTAEVEEFNYLFDSLVCEAKTVFDDVTVASPLLSKTDALPADAEFVLIIGQSPVYLSAHSLSEMRDQLESGSNGVLPVPISSCPDRNNMPIYTLADFHHFEAHLSELYGNKNSNISKNSSKPCELSLWRASAIQIHWPAICTAFEQSDMDTTVFPDNHVTTAGIYHLFIDYYGQTRNDILPYVPENAREVLEIGCGKGHTGALLQEKLGCRVSGVEIQPAIAAKAATRLHKVYTNNIENFKLEQNFDVIMGLDVIEHLRQPGVFLSWAHEHLTKSGSLVAVVPNVGHYSVVRDLMAGRWDYVPIGILCVTHLRFFTRSSLELWLRMAGFSEWEITGRKSALPEEIKNWGNTINADLDSLATEAFYIVAKR